MLVKGSLVQTIDYYWQKFKGEITLTLSPPGLTFCWWDPSHKATFDSHIAQNIVRHL